MRKEAKALDLAGKLCEPGGEWEEAFSGWLREQQSFAMGQDEGLVKKCGNEPPKKRAKECDGGLAKGQRAEGTAALKGVPPHLVALLQASIQELSNAGCRLRVPVPEPGYVRRTAFVMSKAQGSSLHSILNSGSEAERETAAKVFLGFAVPFVGWLLLCKSSSHLAHVDPHLGNFRWEAKTQCLWVLDWGSHLKMSKQQRRALCDLIIVIATNGSDEAIAKATRAFGVRNADTAGIATLMRSMMNATPQTSDRKKVNMAAMEQMLNETEGDTVTPVMRCLATLGGILQEIQSLALHKLEQDVPLSLASFWLHFAQSGRTC